MTSNIGVYMVSMDQHDPSADKYELVYLCEDCAETHKDTVDEVRRSYFSESAVCRGCGIDNNQSDPSEQSTG